MEGRKKKESSGLGVVSDYVTGSLNAIMSGVIRESELMILSSKSLSSKDEKEAFDEGSICTIRKGREGSLELNLSFMP